MEKKFPEFLRDVVEGTRAGMSLPQAIQNTESGNYRVDLVMTTGGPLLNDAADVYVIDATGDVVARGHAVPAIFDLPRGDYTAAVVYKNAQARAPLSGDDMARV